MYQILTLNKISATGLDRLPAEQYTHGNEIAQPDAIMVRSASMHEMELDQKTVAIARAGAGVNNIPVDACSEQGIVVFNTPGANANAVKELVLCALLLTSRKIVPAIDWCKTLKGEGDAVGKLVEKGKSAFTGPEIKGKTLGVVGLGAIGILVANAAKSLGMQVYGYDPYLSVDAAWSLSRDIKHATSLDDIFAKSDYITVHVPLTEETRGLVSKASIAKMKDGVRIINIARGELVDEDVMAAALACGKVARYVSDFASDAMLAQKNAVIMPHLGASTPESEDNCARMAADELKDYLENGNILHSVNLPNVSMPRDPAFSRICIIHRNVPNTISLLAGKLAEFGINIENMQSKSRKDYAYTLLDVTGDLNGNAAKIEEFPDIIKVRVI